MQLLELLINKLNGINKQTNVYTLDKQLGAAGQQSISLGEVQICISNSHAKACQHHSVFSQVKFVEE